MTKPLSERLEELAQGFHGPRSSVIREAIALARRVEVAESFKTFDWAGDFTRADFHPSDVSIALLHMGVGAGVRVAVVPEEAYEPLPADLLSKADDLVSRMESNRKALAPQHRGRRGLR